jgi:hypothetical protein
VGLQADCKGARGWKVESSGGGEEGEFAGWSR